MIAGSGYAACLPAGVQNAFIGLVSGVQTNSTVQCNAAGCMVAGNGVIGYCTPGSSTINTVTVPGVVTTSNIGK